MDDGVKNTSAKPLSIAAKSTPPSVGSSPTRGNSGGDLRRDRMTEREEIEQLGDVEIEFGFFEEGIELYAMKGNGGTIHHHRFVSETPSDERVGEELHRANAAARGYEQAIEDVVDIMEDDGDE